MYNGLSNSFTGLIGTPWGLTVFILLDITVLVLVLALNYKWCTKRLLDILFSFLGLVLFFPFFLVFWVVQIVYNRRTKAYESTFVRTYWMGKKEKISYSIEFACENAAGDCTPLGKFLRAVRLAYYPRLADVFAGRMSFIGPRPLPVADYLCTKEEERMRFRVRPGLISSLERYGGEALTYADLFEEDEEYVGRRSLWKDILYFCTWIVARIRGDKRNKYGECGKKTYLQTLLDSNDITAEEAASLEKQAAVRLKNYKEAFREKQRLYPEN